MLLFQGIGKPESLTDLKLLALIILAKFMAVMNFMN